MASIPATGQLDSAIAQFPVELVTQLIVSTAVTDLPSLLRSSKVFYTVFKENEARILAEILQRQPEFEVLLYLFTADKLDFEPGHMLHPRIIKFDPEWESGKLITLLDAAPIPLNHVQIKDDSDDDGDYNDDRVGEGASKDVNLIPPETTMKTPDIRELLRMVSVVDWWVDRFPALRWAESPEERRLLRSREETRLRRAVARWWLFAWHCHGVHHRNFHFPHKWSDDKRLHQVRLMSTREICELEDLWAILYDTVSREVCSSPERVKGPNGWNVEMVPWGLDEGRHEKIVNTYLKLDPEQLRYLMELNSRCHNRSAIINIARTSTRCFEDDREALSISMSTVLEERVTLALKEAGPVPKSGLIDEDRTGGEPGDTWSCDGCPDGRPPVPQAQIDAFPQAGNKRLAWGDNGSDGTL